MQFLPPLHPISPIPGYFLFEGLMGAVSVSRETLFWPPDVEPSIKGLCILNMIINQKVFGLPEYPSVMQGLTARPGCNPRNRGPEPIHPSGGLSRDTHRVGVITAYGHSTA